MAALPLTTPNWDKLTKKMKETQIFNFDGETFDYFTSSFVGGTPAQENQT